MICKCDSVTLRRKKFSDFELVDPSTKEEADKIFLAGYIQDEEGEKKNVKLFASSFFNAKLGDVIPELNASDQYNNIVVFPDTYNDEPINLATLNYKWDVDFLQINKVSDDMFSIVEGREVLCLKLSPNMPLGTVFRIYIPDFPNGKGVILFPSTNLSASDDEYVEVFFDEREEFDAKIDLYFTLIQLADTSKEEVVLKTKVVDVLNIKAD